MDIIAYFTEYNRYLNGIGICVVFGLATLFSKHRSAIKYRVVASALLLQVLLAVGILKTAVGQSIIGGIADGIKALYLYADKGIFFVFGSLADTKMPWGAIFAIKVLPLMIFFGALMSLLFYLGVIQKIVTLFGRVLCPLLGTTGPETVCAVANSFLGQTESPLVIRNYLATMTRSELFVVMVSGMGTISCVLLAVYSSMGIAIGHLLASSIISIPATILIAKILVPETEKTAGIKVVEEKKGSNIFDAIASGTSDGLNIALQVGAMLVAFISLIALINGILEGTVSLANSWLGLTLPVINLNVMFATVFYPFALLLGFVGEQASQVAQLIGTKITINEFLAYGDMVDFHLPERVATLTTYVLCGFSNFASIGMQVGAIGALAPEKRHVISELGLLAVFAAVLANFLTALLVGLIL